MYPQVIMMQKSLLAFFVKTCKFFTVSVQQLSVQKALYKVVSITCLYFRLCIEQQMT